MDRGSWASAYMKKKGWNEGQGIGKTLQGRAAPVKACLQNRFLLFVV